MGGLLGYDQTKGVKMLMLQHLCWDRGLNTGSIIARHSVHNQRIEQHWRAVFVGVGHFFCSLFYHMEQNGILESTNIVDLFCLHYTFLYINWVSSLKHGIITLYAQKEIGLPNKYMSEWYDLIRYIILKILQLGMYLRKTGKLLTYMKKTHKVLHLMILTLVVLKYQIIWRRPTRSST